MFYYKVTYSATLSKFAMFKIIRAHSLQDANYLFKTFHEGRLGNTHILSFEGIEKSLAELLISQGGIVKKETSNVFKGKESAFKEFKPAIKREKKAERSAQEEIKKLSEFMLDHFSEIEDSDDFVKEGIVEVTMNILTKLLQGVALQQTPGIPPRDSSPELSPEEKGGLKDPGPVRNGTGVQSLGTLVQHPENHPDFDPEQKTEI